jgi:DNA-binding PadR family transcriptional regulator
MGNINKHSDEFPSLSRVEALILGMLAGAPELYGLAMVEGSDGKLRRGTIYVTLQRMQEKGYVDSRKESRTAPEIGIPRRLYSITGHGLRVLAAHDAARERFADFVVSGVSL